MSELEYDLEVDQSTIELEWPFDEKVSTKIKMTNPGEDRVAIKLKTNNPSFRISPSHAFIPPEQDLDVTVYCAGWSSFNPDKNYKHRVVVQYAKVPEDFNGKPTDLWHSGVKYRDIRMPVKYGSASAASPKSSKKSESSDKAAKRFDGPGVIKSFKEHQDILESGKKVIVMYGADWCAVCKTAKPIFEKLGKEYKDSLQTYRMYDDSMDDLTKHFQLPGYPGFIGYMDGEEAVSRAYGRKEEAIAKIFKDMHELGNNSDSE